ncbi:uncharacterized protein LOC135481057 [Liolophura sinensis]|uniref:uncharacterized protein LOC135481057 n=1 Tax=Liolophura sinensis TaxID=3198878 RepID=UPI0031592165
MAALIASRLAKTIWDEFKVKPSSVTLWTDAQIVLHWLRTESINMKPFVGVRVAEIQGTWSPEHWRYVPTHLNPADDISRGIATADINGRWMHGPSFLKEDKDIWPTEPSQTVKVDTECKTVKYICVVQKKEPVVDAERFSSWQRLLRVTSYCFRFIHNIRRRSQDRLDGPLHSSEVEEARLYWIKEAQQYMDDWKTRLLDLNHFVTSDIIRVGGRLKKSQLPYESVHPILLPSDHHILKLIMRDFHAKSCHAGTERTLCDSRREFWILRGRQIAKNIVSKCTMCRKLRQPPHSTLMGDLPSDRLRPFEPPFSVTGVDLFGRFFLKYGKNQSKKAWGAIFTCATSRAVHLEIVDNLSTEAFLQALRRFFISSWMATHHHLRQRNVIYWSTKRAEGFGQ